MSSDTRTGTDGPVLEATEVRQLLAALADVTRIRIVNALAAGELCVCDIVELLALPQSTASRHLAVLRDEGLVLAERRGRFMHYRLIDDQDQVRAELFGQLRQLIGSRPELERERRRAGECSRARLADPCEV